MPTNRHFTWKVNTNPEGIVKSLPFKPVSTLSGLSGMLAAVGQGGAAGDHPTLPACFSMHRVPLAGISCRGRGTVPFLSGALFGASDGNFHVKVRT